MSEHAFWQVVDLQAEISAGRITVILGENPKVGATVEACLFRAADGPDGADETLAKGSAVIISGDKTVSVSLDRDVVIQPWRRDVGVLVQYLEAMDLVGQAPIIMVSDRNAKTVRYEPPPAPRCYWRDEAGTCGKARPCLEHPGISGWHGGSPEPVPPVEAGDVAEIIMDALETAQSEGMLAHDPVSDLDGDALALAFRDGADGFVQESWGRRHQQAIGKRFRVTITEVEG